jgi:hypothetical protein
MGYQDKISYFPKEEISVFLDAKKTNEVKVSLYNINNEVEDVVKIDAFKQIEIDTSYWYKEGFQYNKTFLYSPKNLKSGIYYFENSSPFIIKNPRKSNDVLVVYPSNTVNAYNDKGGRSGYSKPKGVSLSFRRPTKIAEHSIEFFKWIEKQEFNVDYICDRDLDEYANLEKYKVIIIPGHNEYWTRKARRNFDRFVDNGGNALVLSGNTMWWQVRYNGDNMVIVRDANQDSLAVDSLKTILWNDTLLNYPINSSIGLDFDYGGYGLEEDEGWNGYKIVSKSPLFVNTDVQINDILDVPTKEYDGTRLLFENGTPSLDTSIINFYRQELIGYDLGNRYVKTTPSFIVFQKTKSSGVIINAASMNWCSTGFIQSSSDEIKKITFNCIDFLINDKNVFSEVE